MAIEFMCRKIGMTQLFSESGECIPVTVLDAGPNRVVQKKSEERDGYSALQLGFEDRKEKHTTRAMQGHFGKASTSPKRVLYEVRVSPEALEREFAECGFTVQALYSDVAGSPFDSETAELAVVAHKI